MVVQVQHANEYLEALQQDISLSMVERQQLICEDVEAPKLPLLHMLCCCKQRMSASTLGLCSKTCLSMAEKQQLIWEGGECLLVNTRSAEYVKMLQIQHAGGGLYNRTSSACQRQRGSN